MTPQLEPSQFAAFRLTRHHLVDRAAPDPVTVCRDVCGVQAQVMSAARMALWVRMRGLKQASITSGLNDTRSLVKTSCMRQTLHLLPAADFSIYITALRRSRVEAVHRILSRFGVTTKQID